MLTSLLARLQVALPTMLLTRLAGVLAASRVNWLKNAMIGIFSKVYNINWDEIEAENAAEFASFNDFFCRPLRAGARPFKPAAEQLQSPCDGSVGACGQIESPQQLLQAKGISYPLQRLLACSADTASGLQNHHYYTLYLAPHNYHRVHMPLAGTLQNCRHVPGRLFSVAPGSTASVPAIFCRNERVVCWFQDQHQRPWVMVLVGAMMVGSVATVWHGRYHHRNRADANHAMLPQSVHLAQGDEMGRFMMGSTVVLITPQKPDPELVTGSRIWLHQALSE